MFFIKAITIFANLYGVTLNTLSDNTMKRDYFNSLFLPQCCDY